METTLFSLFKELPYAVAFIAGVLTFLSPCILPLLPPYMSYISGISLAELKTNSLKMRLHIFQRAGLFVCGFSLIFVLVGVSFSTIFAGFLHNQWTNYLAGFVIIGFGLHFLGIFRLHILYRTKRLDLGGFGGKDSRCIDSRLGAIFRAISPFILGVGFALGWSPCVGPILSSIMLLSTTDATNGLFLMLIYAAGLALPFLATALAIERSFEAFSRIKIHARKIEILSGILLVLIGATIAFGGLDRLNAALASFS